MRIKTVSLIAKYFGVNINKINYLRLINLVELPEKEDGHYNLTEEFIEKLKVLVNLSTRKLTELNNLRRYGQKSLPKSAKESREEDGGESGANFIRDMEKRMNYET